MGSRFGVGAPPILVYFSWDWDVHWGYDLDFDPWLSKKSASFIASSPVRGYNELTMIQLLYLGALNSGLGKKRHMRNKWMCGSLVARALSAWFKGGLPWTGYPFGGALSDWLAGKPKR